MTVFSEAEKLLSSTLGDHFAERIRIVPQRTGGRVVSGGNDPQRPAYEIRASLLLDNEYDTASGSGTRNGTIPGVMAHTNTLTIEISQLGGRPVPRAGDHIQAIERPGSPSFRVESVDPLGTTDWRLTLVPLAPV